MTIVDMNGLWQKSRLLHDLARATETTGLSDATDLKTKTSPCDDPPRKGGCNHDSGEFSRAQVIPVE